MRIAARVFGGAIAAEKVVTSRDSGRCGVMGEITGVTGWAFPRLQKVAADGGFSGVVRVAAEGPVGT